MSVPISQIITEMIRYNAGDPKRVQHALKVTAFARAIGEQEGLDTRTLELLETAAVLHDIGIHASEDKYHSSAGNYQEREGPPIARKILAPFGLPADFVDRVCFLIGHHHTYTSVDGPDYRILIEADFLVNVYEDGVPATQAPILLEKYFRTKAGREYFRQMYLD
jgi:uncharacterized protein